MRAVVQAPSDMSHGIGLGIGEAVHVALEIFGLEATLYVADIACLDSDADRLARVTLERQKDVAGIDPDDALAAPFVGPGGYEAARPMIPTARLVDEALLL